MRFQPDKVDVQAVLAHGPGWVELGRFEQGLVVKTRFTQSLCLDVGGRAQLWRPTQFSDLLEEDFAPLCEWGAELCIVGTGERLRWPAQALLASLYRRGIGVEVMDSAAACRTYNVLALEGRRVCAALLLP